VVSMLLDVLANLFQRIISASHGFSLR
jgi:hypothetical protein